MTTEILDRAEISGENVIVEYSATEAALAELRQKYAGIVFDLTTTKGDKEARAARLELTTLRTSLEKKRKQFKAPALEFGKKIDSEAVRVTTEILALEDPIDQQIKADEKRRADEKAERERLAAERAQGFRDRIAVIRAFVGKCNGITSERIANGIAMVEQVDVSAGAFEEFSQEAETAKAETLAAMRQVFDETKRREEEAARVEAQRIENERVAAEQKKQADALAAQQAELDRQALELREAQEAQSEQDRIRQEEADKLAKKQADAAIAAAQTPATVAAQMPAATTAPTLHQVLTAVAPVEVQRAMGVPTTSESANEKPTLKLGEICERLGFNVTADFLASLGFTATVERNAKLYCESQWPAICEALIQHITQVADLQPA